MPKTNIQETIIIPEDIQVSIENNKLILKGKNGEFSRNFQDKQITLTKETEGIKIVCENVSKREKARAFAYRAHIKNMIKGVNEGHIYKLKICSSHFPMNVTLDKNTFIVKNFFGEKVPRKFKIKENVEIKIDGDLITITSNSKEKAGQTAADIEQLCRITNKDRRVFQDGIYIIDKDGKEVS